VAIEFLPYCVNALEVLYHLVKSFFPSDALPTVRSTADRIFEPVFIIVNILQGNGLGADVPSAERVVFVTADVQTLVGLNSDFDATDRFAEIATAIMKAAIVDSSHGTVLASSGFASRLDLGNLFASLSWKLAWQLNIPGLACDINGFPNEDPRRRVRHSLRGPSGK